MAEEENELQSKMERLNVGEWHEEDGSVFIEEVNIERLANVLALSDEELKAHIEERLGHPLLSELALPAPVASVESELLVAPVENAKGLPEGSALGESGAGEPEAPLVPDAEA